MGSTLSMLMSESGCIGLYWLPVNRSISGWGSESRLKLLDREAVVRLDFGRHGQKV